MGAKHVESAEIWQDKLLITIRIMIMRAGQVAESQLVRFHREDPAEANERTHVGHHTSHTSVSVEPQGRGAERR